MIKAISNTNFPTQTNYSQNNTSQPALNFGQSNDEFFSGNQKEKEEKTFLQKNWGKILIAAGLVTAGVFLLKKKPSKVKEEIKGEISSKLQGKPPETPKIEAKVKTDAEKNIDELTAKINENPQDHILLNERAKAQAKMGQNENALNDFSKAIEIEPKVSDYYVNRGLVYKQDSQIEKALSDYTTAINLEPRSHIAYFNRAKLLLEMNNIEEASKDAFKALKLNLHDEDYNELAKYLSPKNPAPFVKRAEFYITNKEFAKAMADCNTAIKIHPKNYMAHFQRGLLHEGLGNNRRAMANYSKAIKLRPDEPYFYAKRSNLFVNMNRNEKALKDINKAIEIYPDEPYFFLDRMNLYGKMGRLKEADQDQATLFKFKSRLA